MAKRRKGKRAGLTALIVVVIILGGVGVTTLAVAQNYTEDELTHHLFRDFGIACLISALVTVAYEAYVRYRFDIEKIDTLLHTVYGSSIPLEVWNSIKDTLLSRPVLRQDAIFHLRVESHPNQKDTVVLDVQLEYTLVRLGGDRQYEITHYLDAHICDKQLGLPCFLTASLGAEAFAINSSGPWGTPQDSAWLDDKGCLTIKLRPPDSMLPETPFAVRRREVRAVPGSYFFVMTEVTTGLRIHLEECPESVEVYLSLWPPLPEVNLGATRYALFRHTFLPGHGFEFKFIPRVNRLQAKEAEKPLTGS